MLEWKKVANVLGLVNSWELGEGRNPNSSPSTCSKTRPPKSSAFFFIRSLTLEGTNKRKASEEDRLISNFYPKFWGVGGLLGGGTKFTLFIR